MFASRLSGRSSAGAKRGSCIRRARILVAYSWLNELDFVATTTHTLRTQGTRRAQIGHCCVCVYEMAGVRCVYVHVRTYGQV